MSHLVRPNAMAASIAFALAVAVVAGTLTKASLLESVATASTQSCDTDCQTKMTDCILACDGVLSCEEGCKGRAARCVDGCRAPLSAASSGEPTDAGDDAARLEGGQASRDAGRDAARVRDARAPSRD